MIQRLDGHQPTPPPVAVHDPPPGSPVQPSAATADGPCGDLALSVSLRDWHSMIADAAVQQALEEEELLNAVEGEARKQAWALPPRHTRRKPHVRLSDGMDVPFLKRCYARAEAVARALWKRRTEELVGWMLETQRTGQEPRSVFDDMEWTVEEATDADSA